MNRLVYFEQIAGSARKFYLMTEDDGGSTFTANYGRIGTTGSVKTYPMSKWQHVYNTRIQHGYTDKTRDYLAERLASRMAQSVVIIRLSVTMRLSRKMQSLWIMLRLQRRRLSVKMLLSVMMPITHRDLQSCDDGE